ncbi:MAG: serine/threonine protein kinase, partial [Frankiales bacterium]|nr:serine/threonine protein kinase [Frankiales bacterium]
RADLATDPSFQARFRREAQSAASLDAPTVVAVYDTGEDAKGVPWIVMEYVDGRTLRDILTTEGRLLPARALEVTADICSALEVAHAAGMVHRDIKPANVMLTSRGEVKVMDFGIARAAAGSESTMTQTQSVIGTAAYLSPEQARGEHVDARSDLYSTGCLLYELVTGSPPFVGDSPVAVAYQHVREDPVAPSEFDSTLPQATSAALDAVILKAMAKNPANRYQSADEMREDLLRAVAGRPVLATPVLEREVVVDDIDEPAVRRRNGNVVYAIAGVFAILLAVGVGLLTHAVLGTPNGLIKPPDVQGMQQQAAISALATDGLGVDKIKGVFDDNKPVGEVISQSPDKNFFIKEGGTVDLTISMGPPFARVPRLIGLTREDAVSALTQAKLTYSIVERPGNFPAGQVFALDPPADTQLHLGKHVNVFVYSGNVIVPNVVNLTQDQALAQLGSAGFGIGINPVATTTSPPGIVLSQTPRDTQAPRGSDVIINVSYDPNAVVLPPGGTPTPAPGTSPSPTVTP